MTASNHSEDSDPMGVVSILCASIAFYGGLGWLGQRYLGSLWFLPGGILLGFVVGIYMIVKRYGSDR